MLEENMNQVIPLKNIDEIRDYLIEETNRNALMSKRYKKTCRVLNYTGNSLIVISTITGCVSISAFASLLSIPTRIITYAIGLKIFVITARTQKHMSIN